MHKLLLRQLKRFNKLEIPPDWQPFIETVDIAYQEAEKEYLMLEHALDFTSKELIERNDNLEQTLIRLKETQEQLIESEKMASLGALVAGIAHEVNTPLGVSITAISLLKEKIIFIENMVKANQLKNSDINEFFSYSNEIMVLLEENLARAAKLISSFKQTAADQVHETLETINAKEYLTVAINSLFPALKKTKLKLVLDCPENIIIKTYPGIIFQVITILVMNSIMHAYEPNQSGQLLVSLEEKENDIIITYSDTGKGIPEPILKKIFDPFFTTARNKGGIGLGLSIAYNRVVSGLKGTIKCKSIIGESTTFVITFPK